MTLQKNLSDNFQQLLTMDSANALSSRGGQLKRFKKGAIIYNAGEVINNLFLVESGDVKVVDYQNSNNIPYIKWFNYKDSLMGLVGLLGKDSYSDTAIAMTEVTLRVWKKEEIIKLSKESNAFNAFIFQQILNKNSELEQRLSTRFTMSSRERVIDMLIQLTADKGVRVGYEMLVRSSLTHQEIANYTNTSRQTVTTVLNELKKRNLLIFNRKRILFRDLEQLKALLHKSEIN